MGEKVGPINVIMALLVFLPKEFPNNVEVIHRTINRLSKTSRYRDLLIDFDDFIDNPEFPYSGKLERTLNILKGRGGLIELLSPDYEACIVNDIVKEKIRQDILYKYFNEEEQERLKEIAVWLENALKR